MGCHFVIYLIKWELLLLLFASACILDLCCSSVLHKMLMSAAADRWCLWLCLELNFVTWEAFNAFLSPMHSWFQNAVLANWMSVPCLFFTSYIGANHSFLLISPTSSPPRGSFSESSICDVSSTHELCPLAVVSSLQTPSVYSQSPSTDTPPLEFSCTALT